MKRTYLTDCKICFRWSSVPNLATQAVCREAGTCLSCMKNEGFLLKIRIIAIEERLASIARRGAAVPEQERPPLRELYARKARQLAAVRSQLSRFEARA